MKSIFKPMRNPLRRAPMVPLQFPPSGFEIISDSVKLEEEHFDEFKSGQYYPVKIGDVYASKYQVLGKLGFGTTSTVWLARNLQDRKYVALKVFTRGVDRDESGIYQRLGTANSSHPGYRHVRTALDTLELQREGGHHYCLVHQPMWDGWKDMLRRNPSGRFTEELLKAGLAQLFLALDYLHTECHLVHTDLKADNILQELVDRSVLEAFVQAELATPSPRKLAHGAPVYSSRRFGLPEEFGDVVLGDFGAAVRGDEKRNHDAQPDVYRSPEVMLMTEWSYPVDIWNVGVMIWDLFEGRHLFYGNDPDGRPYTTRAHLAEVIGMLGPPPLDLIRKGRRSKEFFTEDGEWKADVPVPQGTRLEDAVTSLEGNQKDMFLAFVRGMLQWRPEDRKTAAQLADDPWLRS
ncbi:kinase [Hirsutella rhossiliensis]|uniref:non-specific serine/threonine protein kinase n=1 Tax=Hirsutella rhossiliensis TaxID=111463 RepID=A0A9P8SGM5_9HYPO|nr:kinase [Hirsutella rhossiliensis]KAH0962223.1 kinase [Hirsutella rhossiliensis]